VHWRSSVCRLSLLGRRCGSWFFGLFGRRQDSASSNFKDNHELTAQVVAGGIVTSHKGISFAGARLRLPALTEKDLKDLDFLCTQDIDFVGLSFVREPEDVMDLRRRLDKAGRNDVGIIAKSKGMKHLKI